MINSIRKVLIGLANWSIILINEGRSLNRVHQLKHEDVSPSIDRLTDHFAINGRLGLGAN